MRARYSIQGIIGKRKTLMKTVELREKRKKRREELEVVMLYRVRAETPTCLHLELCVMSWVPVAL